jgi:DNA-binding transcriptional ArsR family regulator
MTPDALSATLSALADPTRRAILARLADGEATVNEIAEPFEISLPAVSRHLKVLEGAGLISRGRTAQWRPCRLEAAPLRDVEAWLERYRRFWEGSFDKLDGYLAELKAAEPETSQQPSKGDDDGAG